MTFGINKCKPKKALHFFFKGNTCVKKKKNKKHPDLGSEIPFSNKEAKLLGKWLILWLGMKKILIVPERKCFKKTEGTVPSCKRPLGR